MITQSRNSLHNRARIRAFFAEGVEKFILPQTVDTLPMLLHIALFLFFAGVVVFLVNVNLTIFGLVLSWVSLCTALYGWITCMPIFWQDSPYHTPLSLPVWHFVTGIASLTFRTLLWITGRFDGTYDTYARFKRLAERYSESLKRGMEKTAEETALKSPSEIDTRSFMWIFDCLDEDHKLESFFSGLPDFRRSKVVNDPLPTFTEAEKWNLYEALLGLLGRTLSSDLLPAPVKNRRAMICAKAVDLEHMPYPLHIPVATGIAEVLGGWRNVEEDKGLYAQFVIYNILATRQPHDNSWYTLASDILAVPEASIRDYAADGDSLSLAILIHIVRRQFIHFRKPFRQGQAFPSVLAAASNFDVTKTSPKLQHEFCALWNEIVHNAQDVGDTAMTFYILRQIRNLFFALHQHTDSALRRPSDSSDILWPHSYSVCNLPDHKPDRIPFGLSLANPDVRTASTKIIDDSSRTMRRSTLEPSTSGPPLKSTASASLPDIAVGHIELGRVPSEDLNIRSSPSTQVFDTILPTGLLLFPGCNPI